MALACLAADAKAGEPAAKPLVRFIYLVSADRPVRPDYLIAVKNAARDAQKWYGRQLGGATFRLSSSIVDVVRSTQPAAWFTSHPNGGNPEDWGYNNALADAQGRVGARLQDERFTWIIYSDGPGDKGRGGDGVAYLPENDLLGLVGRHPKEKDPRRWVGGLVHELGHAFGLNHPRDTKKHARAIMWAGFYGGYPKPAYFTDEDKTLLLSSPFFFDQAGRPTARKIPVKERFAYDGGAFERLAKDLWRERDRAGRIYLFREARRSPEEILLNDENRGFLVRLSLKESASYLSSDSGARWQPLYSLLRKPD